MAAIDDVLGRLAALEARVRDLENLGHGAPPGEVPRAESRYARCYECHSVTPDAMRSWINFGVTGMICQKCGVVCPQCGTVFNPRTQSRLHRSCSPRAQRYTL